MDIRTADDWPVWGGRGRGVPARDTDRSRLSFDEDKAEADGDLTGCANRLGRAYGQPLPAIIWREVPSK